MLDLTNLTRHSVSRLFFERLTQQFWRVLKRRPRLISLVLVDDKKMRELNFVYRKKNKVTDVLSFNYHSDKSQPDDANFFGEIVICLPQAARQAPLFWPTAKRVGQGKTPAALLKLELARLFNHGLLHLAGYDHKKPAEAKIMFALADKLTYV